MDANKFAHPLSEMRIWALVLPLIALFIANLPAQSKRDPELQRIYKQMDEREKTFRNFTAKISQKRYTVVLQEFEKPELGEFYYERDKNGVQVRLEFTSPGKTVLTIKDNVATLYKPAINQAQIKNLGKDQDIAEYLAIGLSQSPEKLEKTFDILYKGVETVDGTSCDVLVFKPKLPKVAAYIASIYVWYRKSDGVPVQNKRVEPNGDFYLINFTDEKMNVKIPRSKFDPKLPNGVQKQQL
jgi:outer membrane lipoprotein-sorting protein